MTRKEFQYLQSIESRIKNLEEIKKNIDSMSKPYILDIGTTPAMINEDDAKVIIEAIDNKVKHLEDFFNSYVTDKKE